MPVKQIVGKAIRRSLVQLCWHSGLWHAMHYAAKVSRVQRQERGRLGLPYITRRPFPNFQILTYHRLTTGYNPFFSGVLVDEFARQVRFLVQHYQVVDLAELLKCIEAGQTIPENAVAITFDDGYRDNYDLAFPILEQYHIPATIFLTTGFLNQEDILWNDKVGFALQHTACEELILPTDTGKYWYPLHTLQQRIVAHGELLWLLRRIPHTQRLQLIDEMLGQLAISDFGELWESMLNWEHVRQMYRHGIRFGAHTVTHPMLSRVPAAQARYEIEQSKRTIEEALDVPIELFAYPDGGSTAFDPTIKTLVENAGFRAAVTTILGTNDATTDPYALRRAGLGEMEIAAFASTMCWQKFVS